MLLLLYTCQKNCFVLAFDGIITVYEIKRDIKVKVNVWTLISAAYMSQTRDQERFAISKVAADWHELMISQRIM